MKMRTASACLLGCLSLMACSDEGEDDGTTSTSSVTSGTTTTGGASTSSSSGSTTTGSGGMGGGGGEGGAGGAGGQGFGPCHGYTDDFTGFDPASSADYWATDGAALETTPDDAISLTPLGSSYAGAYSETAASASNCFASIGVEDEGAGSVFFEIVEGTGAGPKVILEHEGGIVSANEILDAMGNGNNLGTLAVTDLRGLRIQVLADEMRFEVDDGGTWAEVGVLTPLPAWAADDVNIGFGMTDPGASTAVFDDYNLAEPQ